MSHTASSVRALRLGVVAVATVAALAACSSTGGGSGSTSHYTTTVQGDVTSLSGANPHALGKGLTIKMGLDLAITGQGAFYGKVMQQGAQLAANQIEAAGGPHIDFVIKDHKSGDASAGVQTTRELGQDDVHMAMYSYIGVLGSAFQGIKQYKILSLDGGGGTSTFGTGKPYFYGSRANAPHDTYAGVAKHIAASMPDAKKVAVIIQDAGAGYASSAKDILSTDLPKNGLTLADLEVAPVGATDVSGAITKILADKPDVILDNQFGTDPGYFLKQLRATGSTVPVIGSDYQPDLAQIVGSGINGYTFANDFFPATAPANDWAKYFVDTYKEAYPADGNPSFYSANYYEDTFILWQVIQRVIAKGGDVNNPDTLLAAFTADPSYPSLYGPGAGKPYGNISFDPTTHSVAARGMGVYQYQAASKSFKTLSEFGLGGSNFKLDQ
jgi:branched-chain amino acid transport system substrate-binding protein